MTVELVVNPFGYCESITHLLLASYAKPVPHESPQRPVKVDAVAVRSTFEQLVLWPLAGPAHEVAVVSLQQILLRILDPQVG